MNNKNNNSTTTITTNTKMAIADHRTAVVTVKVATPPVRVFAALTQPALVRECPCR
jgi:hypothetical protein